MISLNDDIDIPNNRNLVENDTINAHYQSKIRFFEDWYIWLMGWLLIMCLFLGPFIMISLLFIPYVNICIIIYLIWIYLIDTKTPENQGRSFVNNFIGFHYIRNYFSMKLVKTAELPPVNTYMLASFPHGALCAGIAANIISNANRFDELYPGLEIHHLTFNLTFKMPLTRDIILALGARLVSEKGILNILNGAPGNTAVIVPGGEAERKLTTPMANVLVLKNRKGFVRVALKAGSPLVPVFHFNETAMYDVAFPQFNEWLHSKFGLSWKVPKGRYYSFLPLKRPITTVVGKPIKLQKVENPSQELIDQYHQIFIDELTTLFNKYKGKYDVNGENATLTLV